MGMGQRKALAKAFKQHTDKAVNEEVKRADLFSGKTVESELAVECYREPEDAPIKAGERARLVDMRDRIDVFVGYVSVGYVMPSLVDGLRAKLKLEERSGRSVKGRVAEVSDLTATFVITIGGQ